MHYIFKVKRVSQVTFEIIYRHVLAMGGDGPIVDLKYRVPPYNGTYLTS
jgi:hypothetical protein